MKHLQTILLGGAVFFALFSSNAQDGSYVPPPAAPPAESSPPPTSPPAQTPPPQAAPPAESPPPPVAPAVQSPPPQAQFADLIRRGNALWKSGQYNGALALATQAMAQDVTRYEGWALSALCQMQLGNIDSARPSLQMAIKLAPADKQPALLALQQKLNGGSATTQPASAASPSQ